MIDAERVTNPASGAAKARERPILFSSEMVKAILDGRKSMTRRVVKPQPDAVAAFQDGQPTEAYYGGWPKGGYAKKLTCPFGQPGDQLWVRETHFRFIEISAKGGSKKALYRADHPEWFCKWRPSIHMPRWASRLTLEITAVRVERVQDISADDAEAEGFSFIHAPEGTPSGRYQHEEKFARYWDSLNAKRGYGWDANPWVFVISFRRLP